MDIVNEYLSKYAAENPATHGFRCTPGMVCNDGFKMSVQASKGHYCSPRQTDAFPYASVEVGFPNRREPLLAEYAEDKKRLTKTVYGWVPVSVVVAVIEKHGGLRNVTSEAA